MEREGERERERERVRGERETHWGLWRKREKESDREGGRGARERVIWAYGEGGGDSFGLLDITNWGSLLNRRPGFVLKAFECTCKDFPQSKNLN